MPGRSVEESTKGGDCEENLKTLGVRRTIYSEVCSACKKKGLSTDEKDASPHFPHCRFIPTGLRSAAGLRRQSARRPALQQALGVRLLQPAYRRPRRQGHRAD